MKTAVGVSLLLLGVVDPAILAEQQRPTFRTNVDLVTVDISVKAGNTPVNGLTADEFVLYDNGLRQELRAVSPDLVPLDVTFVVDLSQSRARKGDLERTRTDLAQSVKLLRPVDRIRVISFETRITQVAPLQAISTPISVERLQTGHLSAVHDAVVAALIRPVDPDRRHLVIAFTDGLDTASVLPSATLQGVARRIGAVLHVVVPPNRPGSVIDMFPIAEGSLYPSLKYPLSVRGETDRRFRDMLIAAAESTGGEAHGMGRGSSTLLAAFKEILDDYRRSYLLQYEMKGVAREGWHDVKVEVRRPGKYTVRARRGYFVEGGR